MIDRWPVVMALVCLAMTPASVRAEQILAETETETATAAALEDDAITPDLAAPFEDEESATATAALVNPNDVLEIGWPELERESRFDPISAQELLDEIHRADVVEPLPIWPPAADASGQMTWDIPVADDPRVQMWVEHFQGPGKARFQIWLSRLTRFAPLFWPVLEQQGLPRDTIFLSMIESGFSTRATSWASAAGPWQFMPATGRRYGLEVGFWVDDRRDFERSTYAAAKYLKRLYDEFGDWTLAWAAYNTGEGRIRRSVRRTGTTDFWKLSRTSMLYRETKHYVPKLIAAALVSKQPEKFGIEQPEYLPPLDWETITVTTAVDLKTLAASCGAGVTEEDLLGLNPALYRGISPPGREWPVRVPRGLGAPCATGLTLLPIEQRLTYRFHRVARGDTVESLAKRYYTTPETIIAFNKLDAKRLALYDALIIPLPLVHDHDVPVLADARDWNRHPPLTPLSGAAPQRVHRVRSGESLWSIARKYGVTVPGLQRVNGIRRGAKLRIGQLLRLGR